MLLDPGMLIHYRPVLHILRDVDPHQRMIYLKHFLNHFHGQVYVRVHVQDSVKPAPLCILAH